MIVQSDELAICGGAPTVTVQPDKRWPPITDEDRDAVLSTLESGRLSGAKAPQNAALEREYAAYHGLKYALSLNSGTAALHCAAAAVGLRPGDEVIVPAFTFIASAMAMANQGAVPVFCDIQPGTWNLDPAKIEERITPRTKAIVVVHLFGMPADLDEILAIAERHGLKVIEDTAQAHGAEYRGRLVGTLGFCCATSFQQTKSVSGGEGGLFMTNDPEGYLAACRLRIFGEDIFETKWGRFYWSQGVGYNYRNHELSAALARTQFRRMAGLNEIARDNAHYLTRELAGIGGLQLPIEPPDRKSIFHVYCIRLAPDEVGFGGEPVELRDRLMLALDAEGLPTKVAYDHPLSAHPAFRRTLTPWSPGDSDADLADWDRDEFPVTGSLIGSYLLLDPGTPLAIQRRERLEQCVRAVRKVMGRLPQVLEAPFEPLDRRPPRPDER
jgi:perosamine synthetase